MNEESGAARKPMLPLPMSSARKGSFMRIHVVGYFLLLVLSVHGMNELGPIDVAQKKYPAVFIPGNVLRYTVSGEIGYVYNGEAEKFFDGHFSEKDSELYREAELDAKKNLYAYLVKGNACKEVVVAESRKLYQYPDGRMRRVVCFVSQKSIIIRDRMSPRTVDMRLDALLTGDLDVSIEERKTISTSTGHGKDE